MLQKNENAILHEIKPKGRFWLQNNCEESVINRQIWVEKPHRGPRKLVKAWNFSSFTQVTKNEIRMPLRRNTKKNYRISLIRNGPLIQVYFLESIHWESIFSVFVHWLLPRQICKKSTKIWASVKFNTSWDSPMENG